MYKPATTDPSSSPLPQTSYSEAPELDTRRQNYASTADAPATEQRFALSSAKATPEAKILSLRRPIFWLGLILLVVIIAAAVGGGVGGSLAVQKAKSQADNTLAEAITTTLTVCPTGSGAPLPSSLLSTTPTSTSSITDPIYTPLPPEEVTRVQNACPQSDSLSFRMLDQQGTFTCLPWTDYPGNDITGLVAYTMWQCLESCLLANYVQGRTACFGVAYSGEMSAQYERLYANCFLKNSIGNQRGDPIWTALVLKQ